MGLALLEQLTEDAFFFGVFSSLFGKIRGIYRALWPCAVARTVACTLRALYVRCAKHDICAPFKFSSAEHCNSASGGVEAEAWRHSLH